MIELKPNIYYLPGENNSRFPYCACLYLKGRDQRVLIDAKMVISGHAGPFSDNLESRFEAYKQIIFDRDRLLLENLIRPKSIDNLKGANLFYKYYPDYPELIRWFEWVHIEKHLSRLAGLGQIRLKDDSWERI